MRRVVLTTLVLALPLFGTAGCVMGDWQVGDSCDPYWDYYDNVCEDTDTLLFCDVTGYVAAMDCASYCTGGYCGADPTGVSWDACICEIRCWDDGCFCNYSSDVDDGTCSPDGDELTYCAVTNVVGSISCSAQCEAWHGAGVTGSCGLQLETGYNGCVCDYVACDFEPYCTDALTQVWCDGVEAQWTNCVEACSDEGEDRGACDGATGLCICG